MPYRLTETLYPADRTQFVINEGEVPDRLAAAAEVNPRERDTNKAIDCSPETS